MTAKAFQRSAVRSTKSWDRSLGLPLSSINAITSAPQPVTHVGLKRAERSVVSSTSSGSTCGSHRSTPVSSSSITYVSTCKESHVQGQGLNEVRI